MARRSSLPFAPALPGFGSEYKKQVKALYPALARVWLSGGEMLARKENFVELDPEVRDKWGIPVLKIHCTHCDNDRKLYQDFFANAQELFRAAGGEIVDAKPFMAVPGSLIHEVGTCRMGADPKDQRAQLLLPNARHSQSFRLRRRMLRHNGR